MQSKPERDSTTLARRVAYDGHMKLIEHTVRLDDGSEILYEVDESVPFAVATLVVDGDDVILARQYRYPLGRWIYDLPGGAGRQGETPIDAARRELEEELGIVPNELRPLHVFSMNPGRSAWPTHLFLSTTGVRAGVADHSDPAEQIRLARISLSKLDALITDGTIVDPALLVARAVGAASGQLPPLGCEKNDHAS